jgi:FKBP-type peptidyl-prolyl cis-trans isomerase FkpA
MAYLPRPHLRVAIAWLVAGALLGCKPASNDTPAATASAVSTLESTDLTRGAGAAVAAGQFAVVQYTGWLYEPSAPDHKGKEFDSSLKGGTPFRFQLGAGQVIKGWDQGVAGMQIGGKRRLVIPPDLAYGDRGAGDVIPPGATLVFDVDLVGIE